MDNVEESARSEETESKAPETTKDLRVGWREKGKIIVACFSKEEIAETFKKSRVPIYPDEAALIIKNGKIVKTLEEGQERISAKIWDRLKSAVGIGTEDLIIMKMDTSHIQMSFASGLDKYEILAEDENLLKRIDLQYIPRAVTPKKYAFDPAAQRQEDEEKAERIAKYLAEKGLRDNDLDGGHEKKDNREWRTQVFGEDYKPTPLLTRDRESVLMDVRLTLSLLPQQAPEIFKLLKGKKTLAVKELKQLVQSELEVRVFAPRLCQYTGQELRINRTVITTLQQEAEEQLGGWLFNYGIQLIGLSVNPAITDAERMAVIEKEKIAIEDAAKNQAERNLLEARREYDLLLLRQQLASDLEQAKARGDEEEQKILRAAFLADREKELNAEQIQQRIKQIQAETQYEIEQKKKDLEYLFKERAKRLEFLEKEKEWEIRKDEQTLKTDLKIKEMEAQTEADIARQHAFFTEVRMTKELRTSLRLQEMEARRITSAQENEHIKDVLQIGKEAGALKDNVLTEAMRQATMRKALDEGERSTQALGQAEGQRYAKENFREGLASQSPLGVAVQGGQKVWVQQSPPGTPMIGAPSREIVPGRQDLLKPCPHCGKEMPEGLNFCGNCGKEFKEGEKK